MVDSLDTTQLALLIPAFNEEQTLASLLEAAKNYVDSVLVVDDGSSDKTKQIAKQLHIDVLSHPSNRGKGAALQTGFHYLIQKGFTGVITMDGDGQHEPQNLTKFLAAIKRNNQAIIIGNRYNKHLQAPKLRLMANRLADSLILHASKRFNHGLFKLKDTQSGFRYYPKSFLETLPPRLSSGFAFETELLIAALKQQWPIDSIDIDCHYHAGLRKSYYRPLKDSLCIAKLLIGKR